MLKTVLLTQSEGMLPSVATMLKELGLTLEKDGDLLIETQYLSEIGIRKFLEDRRLLKDGVRNADVVIYFSDAVKFGDGIYSITFIIYYKRSIVVYLPNKN